MRKLKLFFRHSTPRSNRHFRLPLVAAMLLTLGCSQETITVAEGRDATVEVAVAQQAEAAKAVGATDPVEPTRSAPQSYSQKLAAALEQAAAAKDAVARQIAEASQSGGQAASDSASWATEMFNGLKKQGLTTADDAQQWLANDWKQAGTWQYEVVTLSADADVTAKLNEMGGDRWECFQVVPTSDGTTAFYFKRPPRSYLKNLPMKDVLRLLPLMGQGGNAGP